MAKSLKVLVAGSGPIIIGQAAEFDYSGSQCCAALREEGHSVVLVNSNPATIQTDPETADTVYIEPLNVATLERIIEKERPDAIMPGMGGQTGLNLTTELAEAGVLEKYGVQPLGTSLDSIAMAEDREKFRQHMVELGEPVPQSAVAETLEEAISLGKQLGYPAVVRPAYTLGGTGGGIAHSPKELEIIAGRGLAFSPTTQVLIEESVLGWQEFEFEVLRDCGDDAVIICSMENLDAMGVHTGESIVVAPTLTLPDVHYQRLRTSALKVVRRLGIIGGCNVQFAFEPASGDYVLIEVNPRVSRSSALASKATGVPIARIATLLALGRRLHELPNLVTGNTSAAFEPALDYVVLKIPRWPFDKFKLAERDIGTQMKSTGETMAIGRSFEEALLKGWRSLGQGCGFPEGIPERKARLETLLRQPNDRRLEAIWEALRQGLEAEEVAQLTGFHTFFTKRIETLVALEAELAEAGLVPDLLVRARKMGFGDAHIAHVCDLPEVKVREARIAAGLRGSYLMVDTCAGEFAARTPYFYSTCSDAGSTIERGRSVIILGSGPIRIGQGIEFDYSTVHGVQAVRNAGYEAVVVNNNPETVSTDFDASDRLYFEPLDTEAVCDILDAEKPWGIILQLGGQTAVNLADTVAEHIATSGLKTRILGTSVENMSNAENRQKCGALMEEIGVRMPEWVAATSAAEVVECAERIGYPVLVRPSFVLGGRGMEIIHTHSQLKRYLKLETHASPEQPVLVDSFLEGALELDVDMVSDGRRVLVGAIMEQIEMAGVHSGDSACVIPPQSLSTKQLQDVVELSTQIARALGIIGAANLQIAVHGEKLYLLEANPRASRTLPFVSKATGVPLARLAVQAMLEQPQPVLQSPLPIHNVAVKVPTFSWLKLPGLDTVLGPEMKSTGEAMGHGQSFGIAYRRALAGGNRSLPSKGTVFLSVSNQLKVDFVDVAQHLTKLGFRLVATRGTAVHLRRAGLKVETVWRISEGRQPDILGFMRSGDVNLVVNLPTGRRAQTDGAQMRRLAVELGIPFITTITGAYAAVEALAVPGEGEIQPLAAIVDF